ncbi:hypothetical protein HPB47_010729 [Ixodes persulcatus]|uniref:Uncharacterized protein n=1 Tax=Ixodes persulcatus TaxID=34615 RepID=A0AC60NYF3_IXOPE|nr:hypothetical protein HPB47_010729 [Ixodes persulcatus]
MVSDGSKRRVLRSVALIAAGALVPLWGFGFLKSAPRKGARAPAAFGAAVGCDLSFHCISGYTLHFCKYAHPHYHLLLPILFFSRSPQDDEPGPSMGAGRTRAYRKRLKQQQKGDPQSSTSSAASHTTEDRTKACRERKKRIKLAVDHFRAANAEYHLLQSQPFWLRLQCVRPPVVRARPHPDHPQKLRKPTAFLTLSSSEALCPELFSVLYKLRHDGKELQGGHESAWPTAERMTAEYDWKCNNKYKTVQQPRDLSLRGNRLEGVDAGPTQSRSNWVRRFRSALSPMAEGRAASWSLPILIKPGKQSDLRVESSISESVHGLPVEQPVASAPAVPDARAPLGFRLAVRVVRAREQTKPAGGARAGLGPPSAEDDLEAASVPV